MKTRILSYLLVFSMILALLPASALAEGESTTTPYITATVKHALDIGWQSQALGVSITAAHPIHTSKVSTPAQG